MKACILILAVMALLTLSGCGGGSGFGEDATGTFGYLNDLWKLQT